MRSCDSAAVVVAVGGAVLRSMTCARAPCRTDRMRPGWNHHGRIPVAPRGQRKRRFGDAAVAARINKESTSADGRDEDTAVRRAPRARVVPVVGAIGGVVGGAAQRVPARGGVVQLGRGDGAGGCDVVAPTGDQHAPIAQRGDRRIPARMRHRLRALAHRVGQVVEEVDVRVRMVARPVDRAVAASEQHLARARQDDLSAAENVGAGRVGQQQMRIRGGAERRIPYRVAELAALLAALVGAVAQHATVG